MNALNADFCKGNWQTLQFYTIAQLEQSHVDLFAKVLEICFRFLINPQFKKKTTAVLLTDETFAGQCNFQKMPTGGVRAVGMKQETRNEVRMVAK